MSLRCCKKPSKFLIKYDCGLQESEWHICAKHFEEDVLFQKNIKEKKEVTVV